MSQNVLIRRIRPYLFTSYRRVHTLPKTSYPFSTAAAFNSYQDNTVRQQDERKVTHDYERRVTQLQSVCPQEQWYPRIHQSRDTQTRIVQFKRKYQYLQDGQTNEEITVTVTGRIRRVRTAGNKLLFVDLMQQWPYTLQGVVNFANLEDSKLAFASPEQRGGKSVQKQIRDLASAARKGDFYTFRGHPHRTRNGELSVLCTKMPTLLAPSLHQIPDSLDQETRARKRHVDMLIDESALRTLKVRHIVEKSLTSFLDLEGFTSVHTPILAANASGAIARPFETEATEFAGEKLALRIAPELWLKRLIVGGMERVYDLGPAFRNEGVDATHNPEFYTCEFYEAYATLNDLMTKTERMLLHISEELKRQSPVERKDLDAEFAPPRFNPPFKRVEFIPTLEQHLGQKLPDFSTDSAVDEIKSLFTTKNLTLPSNPTLPRLLDALAAHYLEPLSHSMPIFITHHPATLSPLAKTFTCPTTGQLISARAELFINGAELANMYEEENSPFQQRGNFVEQAKLKGVDGESMEVDEGYLEALEWGLPPTGGWGCGVDRLVMLFAGKERIGDVLAFGGLRNVVGAGRRRMRD